MKTDQLRKILTKLCGRQFLGVYAQNHLPTPTAKCVFVANTDPCHLDGQHWICIHVDGERGEYFDSYGRRPEGRFLRYMNEHCRYWTFNHKQLQSIVSYFCGQYCVFYCVYVCKGFDMNRVVSMFTADTGLNDALVHDFVCRRLRSIP